MSDSLKATSQQLDYNVRATDAAVPNASEVNSAKISKAYKAHHPETRTTPEPRQVISAEMVCPAYKKETSTRLSDYDKASQYLNDLTDDQLSKL
ncbi:MAG: hypothetical protein WCG42_02670 [Parachlamydiaceae bacterium]